MSKIVWCDPQRVTTISCVMFIGGFRRHLKHFVLLFLY